MVPASTTLRITYSFADYYYTLYLLQIHQNLGRYNLAKHLSLSEAQTRTILQKLMRTNFVEKASRRLGHQLSASGKEILKKCDYYIQISSKRIHLGSEYTVGYKDAIVYVEGTGVEKLNTVVLRDEALMNGALGCTIFLKETSGDIFLLNVVYPPLPKAPLSDIKLKRKLNRTTLEISWAKFFIIVGTGNTVINAQIGAIASAFLLLPEDLRNIFLKI